MNFYNEMLEECNYCPKTTSNEKEQIQTEALSSGSSEKTQVFSGNTNLIDPESGVHKMFDPNKTTIGGCSIGRSR